MAGNSLSWLSFTFGAIRRSGEYGKAWPPTGQKVRRPDGGANPAAPTLAHTVFCRGWNWRRLDGVESTRSGQISAAMIFSATTGRERRTRRIMACVMFAWLNLLLQPCVAGLPAQPVAAGHCDHSGAPPDHSRSCAAMQANVCEMTGEINVDSPQAIVPVRTGALLALLPSPVDSSWSQSDRALLHRAASPATGPPLHIRFCNLRN
jgi:hypothetical protein